MRTSHKIASLSLFVVGIAACGGSSGDDGLFGASAGGASGSGGGSAGKAGTTSGGAAGKASSGAGGTTTGGSSGSSGKAAGGTAGSTTGGAAGSTGGSSTGGAAGTGGTAGGSGSAGTAGKATAGNGGTSGTGGKATGGSAGKATAGTGGTAGSTTGGAAGSTTGGAAGSTTGGAAGSTTGGAAGSTTGGSAGTGGNAGTAGVGGAGGAPPACLGDKTACATSSGAKGLCVGGVCSDCVAPADDVACQTAYPTSNLCAAGSCEACDAPGTTLFVDPVNGSDTRGLGSTTANGAAAPGCALKTITAAIKIINAGTPATAISVIGPATLDDSEAYPLVVPANVIITTKGGDVTAAPKPTNTQVGNVVPAVRLATAGSGIDTDDVFTIDGTALATNTQDCGISTENGSTDATHLRGVTVTNMPGNGIRLTGKARLSIGDGVLVSSNGRGGNFSGIFLTDGGSFLTIDVPSGRPTIVEKSGSSGITMSGQSGAKIVGVPGATPGTGTVISRLNGINGMSIQLNGAVQLGATIDGMVVYQNGANKAQFADGIYVTMNTKATIRRTVALGNFHSGIHVDGAMLASLLAGNQVDLGNAGDLGENWVQDNGQDKNGGVGICFTPPQAFAIGSLSARGNIFGDNKDCGAMAAQLTKDGACSGAKDTSIVSFSPTVTMDVASCTIP